MAVALLEPVSKPIGTVCTAQKNWNLPFDGIHRG
jgi:hypothetical protein